MCSPVSPLLFHIRRNKTNQQLPKAWVSILGNTQKIQSMPASLAYPILIAARFKGITHWVQNIFEINTFECIRSSIYLLIVNILMKGIRKTAFQFLPANAASSSLSDPYCNAIVIADKRSPWADLLLLRKRKGKERNEKKKKKQREKWKWKNKERVIILTINSHPECVSKQVKLMTPWPGTQPWLQKAGAFNRRNSYQAMSLLLFYEMVHPT